MTRMGREVSDRAAIEAQVARVRALGLGALRTLWGATFRSPPPAAFTKDLMARFICRHIQEQAFGGFDRDTAKLLDGVGRGKPAADGSRRLKPGTVLVREYAGERHTVTVVPGGYVWRGDHVPEPLHHRARHHRDDLERATLLRPARAAQRVDRGQE